MSIYAVLPDVIAIILVVIFQSYFVARQKSDTANVYDTFLFYMCIVYIISRVSSFIAPLDAVEKGARDTYLKYQFGGY